MTAAVSAAVRFDLNQPSRQEISHEVWLGKGKKRVTYELLSLPVYAVGELERLLTDLRQH